MRGVKRFLFSYTVDFWVFTALIIAVTSILYFICGLATGLTEADRGNSNVFIIMLGASSLLFVWLMQDNGSTGASPLTLFSRRAGRHLENTLSDIRRDRHQANISLLAALVVVFLINLLSRFFSGQPGYILFLDAAIIAVTITSLFLTIRKGISNRLTYVLIGAAMTAPAIMALLTGGVYSERTPASYVWLVAAIVFSKFLSRRETAQFFFKLAVLVMLLSVIAEALFIPDTDIAETIQFIIVVLSVGFVSFSSLDLYIANSSENMASLEKINRELQETQAQLVQREQMATLGRLIAGVAHEINTPMGAIKASSELMDGFDLFSVIREAVRYSEDDWEVLAVILKLNVRSLKNMRSTIDLRRGKAQMGAYLTGVNMKHADEISRFLADFEICDVEKVADNLDIFRRDNILDILHTAKRLVPLLSSIQNIRFSAEKVTKIVFALKTFSHMNTLGNEIEFDIAKNIDNVLVLYLNQTKRGVEVVRQYDENLPFICGNVEELGQVWTNIVQNAIYAMSYVGTLTIRIRKHDEKHVEVSFTDTGTGIRPENIDRIFEPFFTTKPLGEGSGIGMDISRKVIEKHGGEIRVDSVWGQGTKFTVVLPTKKEWRHVVSKEDEA